MNSPKIIWLQKLAILSTIFLLLSYLLISATVEKIDFYKTSSRNNSTKKNLGATPEYFRFVKNDGNTGCRLQIPDPWHPSIRNLFFNDFQDHSLPTRKMRLVTNFANGVLRITHSAYTCRYRCFELKGIDEIKYGEWIDFKVHTNVSCEFIDVSCNKISTTNQKRKLPSYRMSYTQAVKKKNMPKRSEEPYRPSVVIILVDSVSHSAAKRRLPKTLQFLHENLNLIQFDGHTKAGKNSNPNAAAFLSGIMAEASEGESEEDSSGNRAQNKSIWNDYKQRGFVTYFSEENLYWSLFGKKLIPPGDHFLLLLPSSNHRISLNYVNEMLKIYKDNQLFAFNWISDLAHNQANDLDDNFFLDFFTRSKEWLKDTFLIFMADHGLRLGKLRATEIGRMEDNLPFLSIVVPERFRNKSELMGNLRENSKILTSHFDIHVTLWDILTTDFKDFSKQLNWTKSTSAVRGQSLLRPINKYRTCKTAHIPLKYCPCQVEQIKLVNDSKLSLKLANFIVDSINDYIPMDKCEKIWLESIVETKKFVDQANSIANFTIYRITMKTQPNKGTFEVLLKQNRISGDINISGPIDRINIYGNVSSCVQNTVYAPYCMCNGLEWLDLYYNETWTVVSKYAFC